MDAFVEGVLDLAARIQQIPAPTFREAKRAGFIRGVFRAARLRDVRVDALGNVYARLPGKGVGNPLVLTAHTDTVFPETTDLSLRRESERYVGPGIGDNSLAVAGLLGVIWGLRERNVRLPADLWLVADVCEEGLGNLKGMRAVVERFGRRVVGYIAIEGMALENVYHQGLGVRRYRIAVRTGGGHAWVDYGAPSAVHELARLIAELTGLPLPKQPCTTMNAGVISGGMAVNAIAAEAQAELEIRSEEAGALDWLISQVEKMATDANRPGVQVSAEVIGERPLGEIAADHPLVALAARCLEGQGIQAVLNIGSTDASLPLSLGIPAICVGLTTGGGAHTVGEYIYTEPLGRGLAYLIDLVEKTFSLTI